LQQINYVLNGFEAVKPALSAELIAQLEAVLVPVKEIRTLAMDRNTIDLDLTVKIEEAADGVTEAANSLGQAPAEPAAATAVEFGEVRSQ
jgi:hypothetical protein